MDINATHHKSSTDGMVMATATPISLGRTVTCHEVIIEHDNGTRLCTVRITNFIKDRK